MPLEDVIAAHLDRLFPGMDVLQNHTFRVTRNEDLEVEEDDAENLLKALEKELQRRRFGSAVRLEVEESIDAHVLELLVSELDISTREVFHLPGPLDLTGLHGIADLDRPELKLPRVRPAHARASRRGGVGQPGRHLHRAQPARRAAAPPVRLVRDERPALHRAGGRRPAGARDQADALPDVRRLARSSTP